MDFIVSKQDLVVKSTTVWAVGIIPWTIGNISTMRQWSLKISAII
jgi:hypothetical protein